MTKKLVCEALEHLPLAAAQVLEFGNGKKIFTFYGEMGSGKTTLIKEICTLLGSSDTTSSPTYSIVNEYSTSSGTVYHFDFYRLKSEQEALDMGYEEYLYSGNFCFIEWPEKIGNLLPGDAVKVELSLNHQTRNITLQK